MKIRYARESADEHLGLQLTPHKPSKWTEIFTHDALAGAPVDRLADLGAWNRTTGERTLATGCLGPLGSPLDRPKTIIDQLGDKGAEVAALPEGCAGAHYRFVALSVAAVLSLHGCGGGGGDGASAPTATSSCAAVQSAATLADLPSPASFSSPAEHLIVKLKGSQDPLLLSAVIVRSLARWNLSGDRPMVAGARIERWISGGAAVLTLSSRIDVETAYALAAVFASDASVEYAEPDMRMTILDVPNDPLYSRQWNLSNPSAGIDIPNAWSRTTGAPSIVTAVLDTGYLQHPDLVGNLLPGYDFISDVDMSNNGHGRNSDASDPGDWVSQQELDDQNGPFYHCMASPRPSSWHGTLVAGVIGAAANNHAGIAGISWSGKLLPVRVLGKCGGYASDIADGMRWAAGIPITGVPANPTPARIINLSLGSRSPCGQTFQQAIDDVSAQGVVVVVAAGNDGHSIADQQPANCRGVIAVGASDRNAMRASFSDFGSNVLLSAPGVDVLTTSNDGATAPNNHTYGYAYGTSLAAPQVSGAIALMLAVNGSLTASSIKQALAATANGPAASAGMSCTARPAGNGILDVAAALNLIDKH
ncbi:S8 family peptidase [Burkholderia ambifaria]|uniref:S8 family peptidase n=1 Tax=Burkholderia ambifaria TaxID=152480 RepID=UPI002FE052B4